MCSQCSTHESLNGSIPVAVVRDGVASGPGVLDFDCMSLTPTGPGDFDA